MTSSTGETNGSIKLRWDQIIWGISLISLILLTYSDIKNKVVTLSEQLEKMDAKVDENKNIIARLNEENIILHNEDRILHNEDALLHNSIKIIDKRLNIETGEVDENIPR